ncbi:Ig-like domain-containing domain [Flavihumibacter fluvii]|uniref:Ig-like domain-containing domain n=1 Tax=Flavihumibacter fluvii TaxID=2838157 RepID=UPI001BDEDFE8|nr:Ig-like domain-containing domain [Flavihumibacter fluvii]ULQ51340.1 Ig-like domain-containing protein [Flavihumibacter fluvii]
MASPRPVFTYTLLLLAIFVASTSLLEGCANIIPPLGGPRDTLPPRLMNADPRDSLRNFTGKKIVFTFDEYVLLDQVQENLVVSPTPKINPVVESHLRTVTVRIKDTLEPNTTYVIEFGKAIRDVNENNPIKNFRYIFSTGTYLDSMELSGKVFLAETGKTDSTLIVMLHRNLTDSAVTNERPRYYTKVDKEGNYTFKNIAPGTYALYALKDEGSTRRYLSNAQLFGFAPEPVQLNGQQQPVTLYVYAAPSEVKKPKTTTAAAAPKKKNEEEDKDRRLKYTLSLENNQQDVLKPLLIRFAAPLKEYDSTKIRFLDKKYAAITDYRLEWDTTNTILTLHYDWPVNEEYVLIAEKGMGADSLGKSQLRNDTLRFKTLKESDYGSIKFRFTNLDTTRKPVLQLVQSDKIMFSYPITNRELKIRRFKPAEFELRMLYDTNGNGKWDYGDFYKTRQQPERVQSISKKLVVKGNWDNEVDITL